MSMSDAERIYSIPRRTISNKVKGLHSGPISRPPIYSKEEEEAFANALTTLCKWGFPVGARDLRNLVQSFNTRNGRQIPEFTDGKPGDDWVMHFLRRHPQITQRFASNIKRSRAAVDREVINEYFDNLKETIAGFPPENIYNYDETCFADDPGKGKVFAPVGASYVEKVRNSSKATVSAMFCGSASGVILPPYICYKLVNFWTGWVVADRPKGDPFCTCSGCKNGSRFNRSPHGWFDSAVFSDWFETVFLRHAKRFPGEKALIGDNWAAHFSLDVIRLARENNIAFICLPKNSTHLTQPLDVAFFRPVKSAWKKVLVAYLSTKRRDGPLDKTVFPGLVRKVFQEGKLKETCQENLRSGFKKSGIFPLDPKPVLARIPGGLTDVTGSSSASSSHLSDAVLQYLADMRYGEKDQPKRTRGKKMNVPAGKSISAHMESDEDDDPDQPGTSSGTTSRACGRITTQMLEQQLNEIYKNLLINQEEPEGHPISDSDSDVSINL